MAGAQLTWIDLTATDRAKVRRVLDLFDEQGTVDELGLGSLRDTLSNTLFPGASVLLTRLRYFLFIPWVYKHLESSGFSGDVATEARRLNVTLVDALTAGGETSGIIGVVSRATLDRLASSAYWASLSRWGIFVPGKSQSWYHTHFDSLAKRRNEVARADDPGVTWTREVIWHPRLPTAPDGFLNQLTFQLTHEEAEFLRGRIEERCAGTLLAWLAREGSVQPGESSWDDPDARRAPDSIARNLELARRFSLHVEGAPLLYNLLLAERRHALNGQDKDKELVGRYRAELAEWAGHESQEAPFDPEPLWDLVALQGGKVPGPQKSFVTTWASRLAEQGAEHVADDETLRRLITHREIQLKGSQRARMASQSRLLDWSGRVGVGRMTFRWAQVRQLMIDLHRGLAD